MSYCYRLAKTKHERTQFYATTVNELNIPIKVRGRRQPLALWSVWDDYIKSDYRTRSWKQYRKHQWKD